MTATEQETLRICLLQQLREVGAASSLPLSTLVLGAKLKGLDAANDEIVRSTLVYLMDKSFTATIAKAVSPENKRWRITASGLDFLAEAGL